MVAKVFERATYENVYAGLPVQFRAANFSI
jgi:hypothetical protein